VTDEADKGKPADKVEFINAYSGVIEGNMRSMIKRISDMLEEKGLSAHDADTVVLNALGRIMSQTITYISLLLKVDSEPSNEMIETTMKEVAEDVFAAIQSILSKHSGKQIVHVKKDREGQ
jgi:hypothetical protein